MDEGELLSRARSKIARLPPKRRELGVVRGDGRVDLLVADRGRSLEAAQVLAFKPVVDAGLVRQQGEL